MFDTCPTGTGSNLRGPVAHLVLKDCCKDMEFTCGESMDEAAWLGETVIMMIRGRLNREIKMFH